MKKTSDPGGDGDRVTIAPPGVPPDPVVCTNLSLRVAARQLGHLYDELLAPAGLTATQLRLLSLIRQHPGKDGPALQSLADQLAIRLSALTHALRPLSRERLVTLQPDPEDRRIKHAALTASGIERFEHGVKLWREANARVETVLGAETAQALRSLAEQVSSGEFLRAFRARERMQDASAPKSD